MAVSHCTGDDDGGLGRIAHSATATVEEGALVIARDATPGLSIDAYLSRLDALSDGLIAPPGAGPAEQAEAVRRHLFEDGRLRGNSSDYYDPRNSYLDHVIDRGLGIPISLSIVVLAVCRRAGIEAAGIGFPGHFIVRIGGKDGALVDPFASGRTLLGEDLLRLAARALGPGVKPSTSHLEEVDKRAILIRVLTNLRAIHQARGDHARALVVCDRLVELGAGLPALRDRGLAALALGAGAAATEDLKRYLEGVPAAPDRREIEQAVQRAGKKMAWN